MSDHVVLRGVLEVLELGSRVRCFDVPGLEDGAEGVLLNGLVTLHRVKNRVRWAHHTRGLLDEGVSSSQIVERHVGLDLGIGAERYRAMRWLGNQVLPRTLGSDRRVPLLDCGLTWAPDLLLESWAKGGCWTLGTWNHNYSYCFASYVGGLTAARAVPELADLDPRDDGELADGSRWVYAEALRRVCVSITASTAAKASPAA